MMAFHPLITPMLGVNERIKQYRNRARAFFHEVVLLTFACPVCERSLTMISASRAKCNGCGQELDPTTTFQRSTCCDSALRLARQHYVCTSCRTVVPSHFLFVERVFDSNYFRQRMAESRERTRRRREELRRLMLREQSGQLGLTDVPSIDAVGELFAQLNAFVGVPEVSLDTFCENDGVSLEAYRESLRFAMAGCMRRFNAFPSLHANPRTDRVRRFVALVYMEHDREVVLHQRDNDILVIPQCH